MIIVNKLKVHGLYHILDKNLGIFFFMNKLATLLSLLELPNPGPVTVRHHIYPRTRKG